MRFGLHPHWMFASACVPSDGVFGYSHSSCGDVRSSGRPERCDVIADAIGSCFDEPRSCGVTGRRSIYADYLRSRKVTGGALLRAALSKHDPMASAITSHRSVCPSWDVAAR